MLDTIHFRIHNLHKNATIKNQLATTDKKGSTSAEVSRSTLEILEGDKVRIHLFHDRDNILPFVRRSSFNIPSSHYTVSYTLNEVRDFIDFNVSIPKFEWGTNVLQYIPYYDQSPTAMYNLISVFFKKFFGYLNSTPDMRDLQICRLDLCYNQFFVDKQQALTYLNCQKELCVKYARSSKNNFRTYETSLFYHTRRYSFKIYHKGTEFEQNDRKEMLKRNADNLHVLTISDDQRHLLQKSQYKKASINKLQHEADRILRYEMTFRTAYMDYIIKHHIFKEADSKSIYTSVFKRMTQYDNTVARKVIDKFQNTSLNFFMETEWDTPSKDLNVYIDNLKGTFNFQIFNIMYERFWKKVKDYQLNIPMTPYDVMAKINSVNDITELKNNMLPKRLQKSTKDVNRLLVLAMLSQYMDVENLKRYLPKSSFFRMKGELNKMGINMYNNNHTIPAPPIDYLEYRYIFGSKFNLTLK
ncbi:hypothetical protein H7F33_07165 [Pedobacter sp. PAMC26386]|nr:hypothetical protein H7F33_07165 [Pedobacter sp. PAMC26386]